MKKYLIIGIALILLIALGASAFFYMRSLPNTENVTENTGVLFGEDANRDGGALPNDEAAGGQGADQVTNSLLRQVTTRPVAGAVLFMRDDTAYARYAERGTGYMYEVNLGARSEERISNTTFRQVDTVVFSAQGTRATVSYSGDSGKEVAFGTIEKGDDGVSKFVGSILPIGTGNTGFNATGDTLFYTLQSDSGTEGYQRDLKTNITKTLFTMPLRSLTANWNPSPLIVTAPSYALFGAAYRTNGERVAHGRGLLAKMSPFGTSTLVNTMTQSGMESAIIDGVTSQAIGTLAFGPKCDFATPESLICGVPQDSIETNQFPDEWLMGTLTTNDTLMLVDLVANTADEIVNPASAVGHTIDVTNMSTLGDTALFINRLDSSLWTVSF